MFLSLLSTSLLVSTFTSFSVFSQKSLWPRIVCSCSTEGAIHELWVHYPTTDADDIHLHHMPYSGARRTTFSRRANEFVSALVAILSLGGECIFPTDHRSLGQNSQRGIPYCMTSVHYSQHASIDFVVHVRPTQGIAQST